MAPTSKRQVEADLIEVMKANRLEPGMRAACALLEHRVEKQNQALRVCTVLEFPREQARAYVYEQLLREITLDTISLKG